jgi:hypothetical protein
MRDHGFRSGTETDPQGRRLVISDWGIIAAIAACSEGTYA